MISSTTFEHTALFSELILVYGDSFLIGKYIKDFLINITKFSFANEMTSARRIRLKNKTEVQHRSIPVTPDACIENSLLSIDLLSTVPTVTVIIKNAETDEGGYTSTDLNVDKVYIDLTGEEKGKYTLEIQLPKEAFTGDFELE